MEKICAFCDTSSSPFDDQLGKILRIENRDFHSNCLMYSSDIRQNTDRTKGIGGFESDNIDLALRRCENIICAVCSKPGATVRCFGHDETGISCETSFHLPCALESKRTLHQHYGKFETYCWEYIQSLCIFHGEPITGIQPNSPGCNRFYSLSVVAVNREAGATVRCFGDSRTRTSCETSFHLPCALESRSTLHRSYGKYGTYCSKHIQSRCMMGCGKVITGIQANSDCCNDLYSCDDCFRKYINESEDRIECPKCKNVEDFKTFVKKKLSKGQPTYEASAPGCVGVTSEAGESQEEEDIDDDELIQGTNCGSNPNPPEFQSKFDENLDTEVVSPTGKDSPQTRSRSKRKNTAEHESLYKIFLTSTKTIKNVSTRSESVPRQTRSSENATSRLRDTSTTKLKGNPKTENRKIIKPKQIVQLNASKSPESKSIETTQKRDTSTVKSETESETGNTKKTVGKRSVQPKASKWPESKTTETTSTRQLWSSKV